MEKQLYDIDICNKHWYRLDTLCDHPAVPRVGDTIETYRQFYTVRRVVHRDEDPYQDEIAEAIFDWWISGKSYSRWYAEKFLQTSLDLKNE